MKKIVGLGANVLDTLISCACFPKEDTTSVTKARLATEEMYKLYSRAAKHAEKEIRKS